MYTRPLKPAKVGRILLGDELSPVIVLFLLQTPNVAWSLNFELHQGQVKSRTCAAMRSSLWCGLFPLIVSRCVY